MDADPARFDPQPPAEELDWRPVVAWIPRLAEGFEAGVWVSPPERDGVIVMGWVDYSAEAMELVGLFSSLGMVAPFDWMDWIDGPGKPYWEDPAAIDGATLEDCRRLVTAIVRGDRFSEGSLLAAFERGIVGRVLRRAAELTA